MPTELPDRSRIIRQRELLADLGACALRAVELDDLLHEACRLVSIGMGVHFCKILQYLPAENMLLVRAGVGWKPGVVGHAKLDAGSSSPAGHALYTDEPVLSNDLAEDPRFLTPKLLLDHGIERAMNVLIRGDGLAYGVLEADSRMPGDFAEEDISFLQGAANLLGLAVERSRRDADLRRALDRHEALEREADHRVKNSLQLVASLLTLQRGRLAGSEAAAALDDAIARVHAVARAHRGLLQGRDLRTLSLNDMLHDLCEHIGQLSSTVRVRCSAVGDLEMDAERAIPLGLILSELLTNAVRHAYPDGVAGVVDLTAAETDGVVTVIVSDAGVGTVADAASSSVSSSSTSSNTSLGTTIVNALARQIGATLDFSAASGAGTTVKLRLPRRAV